MYAIVTKQELAPKIHLIEVSAPEVTQKAKPGQFVILHIDEKGERVPLTIAGRDLKKGTLAMAFHAVGRTTKKLAKMKEGDSIQDLAGPLGNPAEIEKFGRVLCVAGGVWCAPLRFVVQALREKGNEVVIVAAGRTKDTLVFEKELKELSDEFYVATDDGSKGFKGLDFLKDLLKAQKFSHAIAMGQVVLLQTVTELTRPYNLKTMVTLASIMVDGMGMCGACRVTVDGETKFACMDGPEFDGHMVDFDELIRRQRVYLPEERMASMIYEKLGGMKRG
jgi:ferredoxin--NADP+ reductase